jgi:F-type H+-transporting ATPase subunit alpha
LDAKHRDVLDQLKAGKINDDLTDVLAKVAKELADKY